MTDSNPHKSPAIPVAAWLILIVAAGVGGFLVGAAGDPKKDQQKQFSTLPIDDGISVPAGNRQAIMSMGETTVADMAESAAKFVVSIEVAAQGQASTGEKKHLFFYGPNMRPAPDFPKPHGRFGMGAGIIIKPDGYIVTSNHVTRGADEIKVTLSDGRSFMSQVAARDAVTDIALLKIPATGLPVANFGDSRKIRPGDWAIAIGCPMRLEQSVSFGIISAVGRSIGDPFASTDLIQTDAAINPGSSGGPLLSLKGEVIGMSCVVRSDAQNIGFAIPAATVTSVAQQLLRDGKISRSYIGVRMEDMIPDHLDKEQSVVITYVHPGSPAFKAGLKVGDRIRSVAGKSVKSFVEVKKLVQQTKSGTSLPMTISLKNDERLREVTLVVEPLPERFSIR